MQISTRLLTGRYASKYSFVNLEGNLQEWVVTYAYNIVYDNAQKKLNNDNTLSLF